MTLYGESDTQFRPRPTGARLVVFVAATTMLAAWLAALISSLVSQAAAAVRMIGREGVPVALFPAGPPDLPGMHAVIDPARLAVAPLLLLVLAAVMLVFWPSSGTLASRLSVTIIARTFAVAALTHALSESPLEWLSGDLSAIGLWRPILSIGAVILLWRSERSWVALLSMFFDLERPSRRTIVWCIASLPQWIVWFLFALVQWHSPGMIAAVAAMIVTMTGAASAHTTGYWEKIARPYLTEDAIIAAVAALVVSVAGFATFGAPIFGLSRHAVVLAASPIAERVPLPELRVTVSDEPLIPVEGAQEAEVTTTSTADEDTSVIDIRWSRDRDQKAARPEASEPAASENETSTATSEPQQ